MASITDANTQLAWLIEQYPTLPIIFETEQDIEAGFPQVIVDADVADGVRINGRWYWSPEEIDQAYHYADLPDGVDDTDWYFDRYAERVIRVILGDEEVDD